MGRPEWLIRGELFTKCDPFQQMTPGPAGGHQPISNEAGDIHVVCNGEIYNFKELRHDLEERGGRRVRCGAVDSP